MAARDCYSKYSNAPQFSGQKITIPEHNYLSGESKSYAYDGSGWYVPSERRWEPYHKHQHLPVEARRDGIEFVREEEYTRFTDKRDRPKAPMLTSYIPCGVPEVKLDGHRVVNTVLPAYTQYAPSARIPTWDGPGYYGYYHEALDSHSNGEFKTLPGLKRYPGYPLVSKTTGI